MTLDGFLWRPVASGVWSHRELFDGTYDFGDLLDIHEFLDVRDANEQRAHEWAKTQAALDAKHS